MERQGPVQVVTGAVLRPDPPPSPAKRFSCSSPIVEIIHFHKAIKSELARLCQAVVALENGAQVEFSALSKRYQFLQSVYKYHSQAEDEVILPALDLRVKNVAHAYSLEHEAEGDIFVQLAELLSAAGSESGELERAELLRQLVCTTEALQTTLRQHLNKEEEQVFPLLMQNFSFEEQAALVWQFMCCIPVNLLEEVLPWVAAELNPQERQEMVAHIHDVVPSEELLLEVVQTWLAKDRRPADAQIGHSVNTFAAAVVTAESSGPGKALRDSVKQGKLESVEALSGGAKPDGLNHTSRMALMGGGVPQTALSETGVEGAVKERLPINEILHFHNAIRKELESFAEEARALRLTGMLNAVSLTSLVERYRFLSDVCIFHSAAEDNVVFKAALDRKVKLPRTYMGYHGLEEQQFSDVGRLLAGARTAEIGSAAAEQIIGDLCEQAEAIVSAVRQHFLDEEAEVLPLVQQHFSVEEQRVLMYQSLRAMPLRLLEQVLPWVMALLSEDEATDMVRNMQLAAPPVDSALVALFSGWANRGRSASRSSGDTRSHSEGGDDVSSHPAADDAETVEQVAEDGGSAEGGGVLKRKSSEGDEGSGGGATGGNSPPRKKNKVEAGAKAVDLVSGGENGEGKLSRGSSAWTTRPLADLPGGGLPLRSPGMSGPTSFWGKIKGGTMTGGRAPIDHIFQFHRAIRRDLEYLDLASGRLLHCDDQFFSDFDGRFRFLWGIYRAHSAAEDDIVFPALEAKEALHNVSHSYSIDHQQEEQLFKEIAKALEDLKACRARAHAERARQPGAATVTVGGNTVPGGAQPAATGGTDIPKLSEKAAVETEPSSSSDGGNMGASDGIIRKGGGVVLNPGSSLMEKEGGVGTQGALDEYHTRVLQLQRMCKSVRVSLDKHVSSEEVELWPLFSIHFSVEEQDAIVGRIIGCTGAEVLQAMLPFVTTALTDEEQGEMMKNWRNASRNTMFDQWLSAWWKGDKSGDHKLSPKSAAALEDGDSSRLAEVAEYLKQNGGVPVIPLDQETEDSDEMGGQEPSKSDRGGKDEKLEELREQQLVHRAERVSLGERGGEDAASGAPPVGNGGEGGASSSGGKEGGVEGSNFKPGWEDIFRMNQKELEAAIRRVSRDSTLEPQRKAYLMQNLMTSRWIVAQQKVAPSAATGGEGSQELRPSYHDEAKGIFGCEHYQRNCKVKAACCGQLVTCRFCHDKDSDHTMDRHAVREMMCMTCLQVQPVAQHCATPSCNGRSMARYYCAVCKFFDDSGKDVYHCPFCNLCRVGKGLGIDFFHCMSCNACMSLSLASHTCREKGLESNCPICHDFLFTSNTPVKALPCGHFMHSLCYQSYTHGHYTCPICSKSLGDMAVYFGMLDALLETEELPEEYRDQKQEILCNDCEHKGTASFHFVYHKCSKCGSYNTRTI